MVIYRNGQPIGLTNEECRKIYEELDKEYKREDIRGQLEVREIKLDVTDELILDVEHALGNNDGYWESYWCSIEYAIEEYMKKRGKLNGKVRENL